MAILRSFNSIETITKHPKLIISGEAVPLARPRVSTRSGRVVVYDTPKNKEYKEKIRFELYKNLPYFAIKRVQEGGVVFSKDALLEIKITEYRKMPKSWNKLKKQVALKVQQYPLTRPDLDNIIKIVLDAFTGYLWKDDSQVVHIEAWKRYSDDPRLEIEINPLFPMKELIEN